MASGGKLSTHVLDTANGGPAADVRIDLFEIDSATQQMTHLKTIRTNTDGRAPDGPLMAGEAMRKGNFELRFHIGEYFAKKGNAPHPNTGGSFLDVVPVRFTIINADDGYHVPLVCSPWSYSTYRGS